MSRQKERLDAVIGEIGTVFRSQGIDVYTWKYDRDGFPSLDGSPQDDVDHQLPLYDVYVGLMCSRVGTPTHDAASGTVKEFLDAKKRWERTGAPRILFYFCRDPRDGERTQVREVTAFREQFPGLFSTFENNSDLEKRFRQQFLRAVLDILNPRPVALHAARPWIGPLAEAADRGVSGPPKPSTVARGTREHAEKLFCLGSLLTPEEQALLTAVAYTSVIDGVLEERVAFVQKIAGAALEPIASAIAETQRLIDASGALRDRSTIDGMRCDLVAAIVRITRFIRAVDLPEQVRRAVVMNEGVVATHYVVPNVAWIEPLRTLEASRFGVLWSEVKSSCVAARAVFVLDDVSFAIDPQLGPDDPTALDRIRTMTPSINTAFPPAYHFGDEKPLDAALRDATYLPLPMTRFDHELLFVLDPAYAHRLQLTSEDGQRTTLDSVEGESELRFTGASGAAYQWALMRLYDDIVSDPIGIGEVTALTEGQHLRRALAESADDSVAVLGSLGCWNEIVAMLLKQPDWTDEHLALLHSIFDQALAWWDTKGIATLQDKLFRDAINAVSALLEQRRTTP